MNGESGLMFEEHVSDLLPGYALGILDDAELLTVSEHLKDCPACQQQLAAYAETVGQLAMAATQAIPATGLKTKVLQKINLAAVNSQTMVVNSQSRMEKTITPPMSFLEILRNFFRHPAGMVFGLLTLVVILFLGVNYYLLRQQVNELQAQVPSGYMQVIRLEASDIAPEASGYVMVFKNQNYGSLAVTHAPLLSEDQQYQIWLIKDGVRTSGGVFSVNETGYGNLMVSADQPLGSFQSFGITIEPFGGSPQPTGEKILGIDL
jgi:anti-sigma-K factor RskA